MVFCQTGFKISLAEHDSKSFKDQISRNITLTYKDSFVGRMVYQQVLLRGQSTGML